MCVCVCVCVCVRARVYVKMNRFENEFEFGILSFISFICTLHVFLTSRSSSAKAVSTSSFYSEDCFDRGVILFNS